MSKLQTNLAAVYTGLQLHSVFITLSALACRVGKKKCMVQAMSYQIDVKVQADPLPEVQNVEHTTGYWGKNSTVDLSAEKIPSPPPRERWGC